MDREFLSFSLIPNNFQKELFVNIAGILKSGEPVQLYGVPGSGNSLIAKTIVQSQEIRNHYFGSDFRFLLLDANMLLERSSLGLSRLLFSLLSVGEVSTTDNSTLQEKIEKQIVEINKNKKLILLIDHMQELSSPDLKAFFINLYGIYRKIEPNLNFIFILNRPFLKSEDVLNFGPMARLIIQNPIRTTVFNKGDSFWFIEEKEKQIGISLSIKEKFEIYKLGGGFPRTLKRLVESVGRKFKLEDLAQNPTIDASLMMHFEEMLIYADNLPDIPIFEKFIESISKNDSEDTVGGIRLAGRLTKNEEKLLRILVAQNGKILSRDDGISSLWGEKAIGASDHAYDQIVLRLRSKLKTSTPKTELQTIRGRGHVLKI